MPFLLIKITWGKWFTDEPWLPSGELQAAALFDLRFRNSMLSVWKIEDNQSNVDRVVTALAATNNKRDIENLDYVLFEMQSVLNLGIKMEQHPGATPDVVANNEWHHDLTELTASKIVAIAHLIRRDGQFKRLQGFEVKDLLLQALNQGHIALERLPDNLKPTLQRLAQGGFASQPDH